MDVQLLKKQRKDLLGELFLEEFLDDYFRQLHDPEEHHQSFASILATEYFKETDRKIDMMRKLLDEQTVDFRKIDEILIKLKGGTGCIGFRRLHNICIAFLNCCRNGNREGCMRNLQQFKDDMDVLRNKLTIVIQIEHLIVAAGGSL